MMAQGGEGDDGMAAATEQARLQMEAVKAENDIGLKQAEFEHRRQMDYMKLGEERRRTDADMQMKAAEYRAQREDRASELRMQAAAAAQKPQTRQPTKGLR